MVKRRHVIPPGWEARHRPTVQSAMTARCDIRGPQGKYDYETGTHEPGELIAANIPCRVLPEAEGRGGFSSGDPIDTRSYFIAAPIDEVPDLRITDKGPILYVTGYEDGHAGDPHLLDKPLRITNTNPSSITWERVLTATLEV